MIGSRYSPVPIAAPAIAPAPVTPGLAPDLGTLGTQIATARNPGLWDRIDGVLKQPHMSGAMLRAAGAFFNGDGLAGALAAGGGYMDGQHAMEQRAHQQEVENQLARDGQKLREFMGQNQVEQGWGNLANDTARITEQGRANRAREGIDANGQRIQLYGIDTGAQTARRGQDVSLVANQQDNNTSRANAVLSAETSRYTADKAYDRSVYGTDARYPTDADGNPIQAAGIGSKGRGGSGAVGKVKIKGTPARNGWFSDTAATPDQELDVFPLPSNASPKTLTPGRIYQTARGNARWNGSGFDPL